MKRFLLPLLTAVIVLLFAGLSSGAGFWIPEFPGAASSGMAMAFTAQADDASALYFNPSAIAKMKGINLYMNNTLISYTVDYKSPSSSETDSADGPTYAPFLGLTYDFGMDNMTFGIAGYNVFGLKFQYPDSGAQRYLVQKVDLMAPTINPTLSFTVMDNLSLGLGIKASKLNIELDKAIDTYGAREYDIDIALSGSGYGYGYDISLLYEVSESLRFGIVYDSEITFDSDDVDLEVDFPATIPYEDKTINGETELTLPASLRFGMNYRPLPRLSINLDINWMNWKVWDEIVVDLDEAILPGTSDQVVLERHWKDSFAYRLGGEYQYTDDLCFRAGVAYEEAAITDEWLEPGVPDTDKYTLAIGMGYNIDNFSIDLSLLHFLSEDREIRTSQQVPSADGDYSSDFTFICLGFGYSF